MADFLHSSRRFSGVTGEVGTNRDAGTWIGWLRWRLAVRIDKAFQFVGIACMSIALIILAVFLYNIVSEGITRIDWDFITSLPSRKAERAGILTAWTGTAWILGLTAIIAIPIGIAAGIYLEEYGKKNRLANIIEVNIANLAGVPSIIYGLLGLEIFVRMMQMGSSILAGAFTLALLILPVIIVDTRETLKGVPKLSVPAVQLYSEF